MKTLMYRLPCFAFLALLYMNSAFPKDVLISVEVAPNPLHYRIVLKSNTKKSVEFDESTFIPPQWGIAPYGARIVIRDRNNKYIYLGEAYSSNLKISELFNKPPSKWSLLSPGQTWSSERFSICDLADGMKRVATEKNPKKWKDFKITFWLNIDKESPIRLNGDSGWISTEKIPLDEILEANRTGYGDNPGQQKGSIRDMLTKNHNKMKKKVLRLKHSKPMQTTHRDTSPFKKKQ